MRRTHGDFLTRELFLRSASMSYDVERHTGTLSEALRHVNKSAVSDVLDLPLSVLYTDWYSFPRFFEAIGDLA
jgi:hypothetical protein